MLQQKVEQIECLKPRVSFDRIFHHFSKWFQPLRIATSFLMDHLSRLLCSYMAKAKNLRRAWEAANRWETTGVGVMFIGFGEIIFFRDVHTRPESMLLLRRISHTALIADMWACRVS